MLVKLLLPRRKIKIVKTEKNELKSLYELKKLKNNNENIIEKFAKN